MWLYRENSKALFKALISAFGLTALFYSNGAYAVNAPNLAVMLTNFATSVPSLMQLVTAGAYVMGMFFVVAAIMGMKHFGEMRTMASPEHSIAGPLIELCAGIALLYLPSSIQTGLSTFWTTTNPYAYVTSATDQYSIFINTCYTIFQLLGIIAFIRGILILTKLGGGRGQQGMLAKAVSHMVGGIICINMYNFIQVLETTVGWTP